MKKIVVLLALIFSIRSQSQVAINTDGTNPSPSAMLDIKSNNKGVLLSRMTTAQRKSIAVQPSDAGLLAFDTDQQMLFMYDGLNWLPLSLSSPGDIAPVERTPTPALNAGHNFGNVVALSGNYAFISSGLNGQDDEGSVYVFERTAVGWNQQVKLTASDATADRHFGASIAVHGDYAIIGTRPIGVTNGRAYIFMRNGNTWTEQAKLTAPDGVNGDFFGISVAITTDMVLIGANGKDVSLQSDAGGVYVFKRTGTNWNAAGFFGANAPAIQDHFATSIAVHGNYAVVGIPDKTVAGATKAGMAQVFFYNGINWVYQATLLPPSVNTNSHFGSAVAIYEDHIAVGQPGLTVLGNASVGRVSVYHRSGASWSFNQSLFAENGQANDVFGTAVALNGEYVMVSAPAKSVGEVNNAGVVYAYRREPGSDIVTFKRVIKSLTSEDHLAFGTSVGIGSGVNTYVIGAPGRNVESGCVSFGFFE